MITDMNAFRLMTYRGVIYPPDDRGIRGCYIPQFEICACGRSDHEAVIDAGNILHEVAAATLRDCDGLPAPLPIPDEYLEEGGRIVRFYLNLAVVNSGVV